MVVMTDVNAESVANVMRDLGQNIGKVVALLGIQMSEKPLGIPPRIEVHVLAIESR